MRYKFAVIGLALLLLGLAGCADRALLAPDSALRGPAPPTSNILRLAVQVSRGEATLAELERPYQKAGIASGVAPDAMAVAQILDENGNGNGYLDGAELIAGIQHYASGQPLDGRAIDGRVLIGLIQIYAARTPLSTPTPSPGSVDTAFLALINQYRSQSGQCWDLFSNAWVTWPAGAVRELSLSSELTDASIYHSRFMAEHDCFAHQCPGEPDLQTRIEQASYTGWTTIGENIASGMETPKETFDAWRNSPGHNQNMLTCQFEEIGVARIYAAGTQYGWYWTTDFGSR